MKKIFKYVICLIAILFFCFFCIIYSKKDNIEKVLKSSDYDYLTKEAKNYIKEVYKKSNEVILTEKNKKYNTPYLNPNYIEYLSLSEEEKKEVELIPNPYIVDYISNPIFEDSELPSQYDLRNVNGYSYITPLKNQNDSGLCWAFSISEQLESYLMVKNNAPYNPLTTDLISPRQMDYALSNDGIKNYENEYGQRELLSGSNFYMASDIMAYGLTAVSEINMPYNESTEQKELYEILNFDNSNYEVETTTEIPNIRRSLVVDPDYLCLNADRDECISNYTEQLKEEYLHEIKSNVYQYGGGIVDVISPQSACNFKNADNNYTLETREGCYNAKQAHQMQIIGWDDDYEYSYCYTNEKNYNVISGSCSTGVKKTGKGAFILRNSWGESPYGYVYLTYDSFNNEKSAPNVSFITNVIAKNDKSWDNIYKSNAEYLDSITYTSSVTQTFTKKIEGKEKLEKIKFRSLTTGDTYSLKLEFDNEVYNYDNILITTYPGIYTIDLSDKNIVIDGNNFDVTLSADKGYLVYESISAFTSNIDDTPIIKTDNITTTSNEITVLSHTKNINSNEEIEYKLFYKDIDMTDHLMIENNIVAQNNINTKIVLDDELPNGEYTLKTIYDNNEYEVPFVVNILDNSEGGQIHFYSNYDTNLEKVQAIQLNSQFTLDSNTFTRVGYKFINWNTESNGKGITYSNQQVLDGLVQDMYLYAQWDPIEYRIRFNSNDGNNYTIDQTLTYDKVINLRSNTFTRAGYKFVNWNTESNGKGIFYADKNSVVNLTTIENGIINLYAQWEDSLSYEINNYSLDYNNNYIGKILVNTTVDEFKSNIVLGNNYSIDVDYKVDNNKNILYTGGKTKIYKNQELKSQFTNIVMGDINGDGKINSADLLRVRQHLLNTINLSNVYFLASDINGDGKINSADLLRVRQHLLGSKLIS